MPASRQTDVTDNVTTEDKIRHGFGRVLFFGIPFGFGFASGIYRAKAGDAGLETLLQGPEQEPLPAGVFAVIGAFNGRASIELTLNSMSVPPRTYGQAVGDAFIGAAFMYGAYKILERAGYGAGLLIGSL